MEQSPKQSPAAVADLIEPVAWITEGMLADLRANKAVKYKDLVPTKQREWNIPLVPAASLSQLSTKLENAERERDELRAAIFGGDNYDPILRNGNFIEMIQGTEAGRLGAIDRAEAAADALEAERSARVRLEEALRKIAEAYQDCDPLYRPSVCEIARSALSHGGEP